MTTKSKYTGWTKRALYNEAKKQGLEVGWRTKKSLMKSRLDLVEQEKEMNSLLLSPEDLILAAGKPATPSPSPREKARRKFRQVEVTYYGGSGTLQHRPPAQQFILSFRRGVKYNLYQELWRLSSKLKNDKDELQRVYKIYAKHYKAEAKKPGSDWHVTEMMLGHPIKEHNKASLTFSMQMREILNLEWQQVIDQVKAYKHETEFMPRPYIEILTMLMNLETEGGNRKTLLQFLMDEIREIGNMDGRNRETSE